MSLNEDSKPYYSPSEIATLLIDCGYRGKLEQLESGRHIIRSATSGYKFAIYLYTPKDEPDHVTTMQFTSSFTEKYSLERVNKWNADRRFVKAYCDGDGDLCLERDVIVQYVAPAYFKECFEFWDVLLGKLNEI